MLEGVITTLINKFLSKYVRNLDKHQLGLHLLGGELRLENVTLKGEAFSSMHLPVEVEFGFIGLVHVQWNWTELLSKPLVIEVRDVLIVLREKSVPDAQNELEATGDEAPVDAEKLHAAQLKSKLASLQSKEDFRLAPEVLGAGGAPGFFKKVMQAVIDNVRVHVKHVHVRYEHAPAPNEAANTSTPLGYPVALGLVLNELTVRSTDEHWESKFVEPSAEEPLKKTHKMIDVAGVFVYCNTRENPEATRDPFAVPAEAAPSAAASSESDPKGEEFTAQYRSKIDAMLLMFKHVVPPALKGRDDATSPSIESMSAVLPPDPTLEFLVHPINLSVRAIIDYKSGEHRAADSPLANLKVLLPVLEISISQRQTHALLHVVSNLAAVQKRLAVFSGSYHHESLDRAGTIAERERYIDLYKRTLNYSWQDTLSTTEGAELQDMEAAITQSDIDAWRVCAMAELVAEMPPTAEIGSLAKRQKHVTGLMANVNNAAASVKKNVVDRAVAVGASAAAASSALATSILPGIITDKLGLTNKEQRAEEENKTEAEKQDDAFTASEAFENAAEAASAAALAAKEPQVHLTDDQRAQLRAEALTSSEILFLPTGGKGRDTIQATIDFTLGSLAIKLLDDSDDTEPLPELGDFPKARPELFKLSLDRVHAQVLQRIDSVRVALEVGDFALEDFATEGTLYRKIISVKHAGGAPKAKSAASIVQAGPAARSFAAASTTPFSSLTFEANPLDETADSKILVGVEPLEIVVHPAWIAALAKWAELPQSFDLTPLTDGADATLMAELLKITRSSMEHQLSDHKSMSLSAVIGGPRVVIVSNPLDEHRTPVLVVDIDSVAVRSRSQEKKTLAVVQDLLNQYTAKVQGTASGSKSGNTAQGFGRNKETAPVNAAGADSLEALLTEEKSDIDEFYDSLIVDVVGVSMSVSPNYNSSANRWKAGVESTPLLRSFDIKELAIDLCVAPHVTFLPATRIRGALPEMHLELSCNLVAQLTSEGFLKPWLQLGATLEARSRIAKETALDAGVISQEEIDLKKVEAVGGAAPTAPASLKDAASGPEAQRQKQQAELQQELHESISVAEANPPAAPALSTLKAQEAAGFDFGVRNSLHPSESAWGASGGDPDRTITLKELIIALKSEKVARLVLEESGAYSSASTGKKLKAKLMRKKSPEETYPAQDAPADETISLGQFQAWYAARKELLKLNKTMELDLSIAGVHVALIDDSLVERSPEPMPSSLSAVPPPLAGARKHDTILEFAVLALTVSIKGRSFDNHIALQLGFMVIECGDASTPLLRTIALKKMPGESASQQPSAESVSAPKANPFLWLSLKTLSPESPDYARESCNTAIQLAIGELELNLDPAAIDQVGCFVLERMMPLSLRKRLAADSEAQAEAKKRLQAEHPLPRDEPTSPAEKHDPSQETTMLPVSERKVLVVQRNIDSLPGGFESVIALQLNLTLAGVTVNLVSRRQSFASLAIVDLRAQVTKRINQIEASVDLHQLWLLDATAGMDDRDRAVMWIAQTIASAQQQPTVGAAFEPAAEAKPFVHAHFQQYDVAHKAATGFAMALDAQVIGLRLRASPLFALHMLGYAQAGKNMRVLKVLESEKKIQADETAAKEAEKKRKEEEEAAALKAATEPDGSKPSVPALRKLRHRRPAKLKQKEISWSWSDDTPAPIQLDVLLDDIQIELPLLSLDNALEMTRTAKAAVAGEPSDATVEAARAVKREVEQRKSEAKESGMSSPLADKSACVGHSLIVRVEALRAKNILKDADKTSAHTLNETVRYEHFTASLGAIKILTTHGAIHGSPYFPLFSFHGLDVGANRFGHGSLFEVKAELGCIDVALPHDQYVFLMRLADTAGEVATVFGEQFAAKSPVVVHQEMREKVFSAAQHPKKLLVRAKDGSLESKEENEARIVAHEHRKDHKIAQAEIEAEEAESDEDEELEEGPTESADPLKSLPSLKVAMHLTRFRVDLLQGDGLDPRRDSLLRVLLQNLNLNAALDQTTGDISADLALHVLSITDTSVASSSRKQLLPPYRNILNFGVPTASLEEELEQKDAGAPLQPLSKSKRKKLAKERSRSRAASMERAGESSEATSSQPQPQSEASSSSSPSSSPPLLVRVHRQGYGSLHAIEVDASLNNLQLFLSPALLTLPKFLELPADLVEARKERLERQAAVAAETKEREARKLALVEAELQRQPVPVGSTVAVPVGVLASDEDKAAFAPSIDPLLMADALLTGSASASKQSATQDPEDSTKTKKATPPIFARFRMTNPLILLVADPCAADTRGLVVSWGLDASAAVGVTPGSVQAQLNLSGFSIIESGFLVTNPFGRDSQLAFSKTPEGAQKPILAPFTLRASVQTALSPLFADGVAQSVTVDVHLSRLDLNVGFRLSQLLQASMNSLNPPEEKAAESERKAIDERKTTEEIRADIVTTIDKDRRGGAGGAAKDPLGAAVAAQPVPALNFTEINLSLKSSGVYVNVINDAWQTNLPFFRVQIDSLLAKVHRMGDSGGVWGGLELRAEMYNHRILAWEPVIEPWSADFSAGQCQLSHTPAAALLVASTEQMLRNEHLMINGAGAKPAPPVTSLVNPLAPITSISFTSTRPLNINISAATLEDLADVAQEIQHAIHSDAAAWKRVSTLPLYRVENHTDLAMDVFRTDLTRIHLLAGAGSAVAEEDLEEVMHILPFSNAEMDFSDQISSTVRAVRVQLLAAHGGLPSLTVPVARETSSKHELTPADGSGAIQVCVDVDWSKGVRVIAIHSSMAVANQTNVPLIVSADRYQEKELVPGERMWLPLLVAPQMHTIRVKPGSLASRREFQQRVVHREGVDAADVQELVTSVQGEFGWSEEIVLAAPQANTKQKSTLVDHFSCPPDRSLAALPSASSLSAQEGKVSVESGASVDRRSSSLPSQAGAFHFTCFLSGCDLKNEHATVSAGIKTNLKRADHGRDAKASTFHIRTPITLENVLACEVQMRILNGDQLSKDKDEVGSLEHARICEELTLARGKTCPIYGATTAKDAFISLHIPTLAAGWSKPIKLKLSSTKSEVEMAQLVGDNGGTLYVCVELQQLQGNLRVVVYTQYWLWDLSSLSLQVTPDKHSILPQRALVKPAVTGHIKQKEAHLESISLPDKHAAVMFSYDSVKTSKKRLWARAGRHPSSNGFELSGPCSNVDDTSIQWSEWSEDFSVDAVGNQSSLSLSMTPHDASKKHHHASRAGSYEIVADVQPGSGIFHRTKMVRFLPRYVLVNSLHVPIQVKQYGAANDAFLTIAPSQQIIWHWPNAVIKNHPWLTMRRVLDPAASDDGSSTDDWHWSGYFDFDASTAADANLCVRHRHDAQRLWFPHLDVRPGREGNGMSFLVLSETAAVDTAQLKLRLPYCIRNKSRNEYLRVRQWIDAKKHAAESSHLDEAVAKEDAKAHKHHLLPMLHSKDDSASSSSASSSTGVPSDDDSYGFTWRVIPPLSDLPFCYEEPLLDELAVQIQIGVIEGMDATGAPKIARWIEGSKALSKLVLDNFEEEHAFVEYSHVERSASKLSLSSAMAPLAASRKLADPNKARLYYFTDQEGPTNFLVFSDEPSDGWKKKQIHERQSKLKKKDSDTASSSIKPASDGMSKRRKVSTDISAEEKEHVATEGQKVAQVTGNNSGEEAQLGAQTSEQAAMPSAPSEIALAARKSHSRSSSASSDSGMRTVLETRPLTESGMRRPLPRALQGAVPGAPFAVTARNLSERVSQLRVRVVSAKSLRTKDKTLFAKVIFGDQVRQTEAHKKEADSVAWNQEVVFKGAELGTRFAQHIKDKQQRAQLEKEEAETAATAAKPSLFESLGITSPTATPSAAVHRSRLPPRVHHPPLLFRRGSVPDQQHVFIDVYQCHTLLSNTRIGSVSININNISDQAGVAHWYELRKTKGANSEMRGMIQLAIWFELNEPTNIRPQLSTSELLSKSAVKSEPQQGNPKEHEAFAAEPRGQLTTTGHAPPRDGSQETFAYAHANVYASAVTGQPETQSTPPQFEPLHPEDHHDETEHDEELEHVIAQMMEDESIAACSWSEYSVRIIDTLNLERVASALMVDPSEGRVVCYLTGPLFRRGYSVLVSDRTETNMLKSWANQEILFALPDELAAQAKQDAFLRFSFYFYASNSVNGQAPLPTASDSQRVTGASSSGATKPILLGTTTVPLLSIFTQKLDSLPLQKEQAPEMDESAHENEQVDVAHMDSDAKARHKVRRQLSKQKSLSPDEAAAIEWEKKWLPLGTPGQTSESASMCVRIIRREVKMPLMQAVSAADKMAAYAPPRFKVHLQLPLLGISLIDRSPEEVAYFALQNLRVHVEDSATRTSLRVGLDKIQLDDLMHDAIYPVILSAAPVHPKEWMPVLQLAINKQKVPGVNIQCFEYVSFLLQTLDIKVNEICLWELLGFLQGLQAKIQPDSSTLDLARKDDSEEQALIYRRMSTELMLPPASISSLYFKFLHLQPLAINLTFQADQESRSEFLGMARASVSNPLMVFLSVLEAGVGSLEGAPIRLDGKIIEHRLGSPESFVKILAIHYVKQGLSQLYKVFGSLAVLGNPVGTTAEIGRGVKSFFYEPAKGAMVSPEAFTAGLASGSLGLIRHSVSGLGGAVAGVFSSGGKAAAALSMDPEFVRKTNLQTSKEPEHLGQGLSGGAKSLAGGVKEGITGLVLDPLHGAKEGGAKGFFKGLGTGIVGVFAKPVAGAMSMVAQTTKGIANTGDYLHDGPRARVTHMRPKRYIDPASSRLTVYDARLAEEALEDEKLSAGDVARKDKRELAKHETSTQIMASVDSNYPTHSNPQMTSSIRADNEKQTEQ